MDIFNLIGSLLGYLLWFLYVIFRNYGVAIIFFAVIVKLLMFPMTLKQQRSMAGQSKLAEKQKELQKIYGNDKARYNVEVQKLYEKEGVNPGAGCLTTLLPIPIMIGILYSIYSPLSNTLHIAADKVKMATDYLIRIPGFSSTIQYPELEVIKNWDSLKSSLTMFSAADVEQIDFFTSGFTFLGLDLLKTPQTAGFFEFLWLIPVFSLISAWSMSFFMNRTSAVKQPGCSKVAMYILPLMSAWWGFIFPAAVGFYWVISSITGTLQSVITQKFFSAQHLATENEARRFVTMEMHENKYVELPMVDQNEIREKLEAQNQGQNNNQNQNKVSSNKKKTNKSNKSNSNYLGNKK